MIRFLVFADLHYKKGMYAVKVQHLEKILDRAREEGVDLVLHAGDFSNDYHGSGELVKKYLSNEYHLSHGAVPSDDALRGRPGPLWGYLCL